MPHIGMYELASVYLEHSSKAFAGQQAYLALGGALSTVRPKWPSRWGVRRLPARWGGRPPRLVLDTAVQPAEGGLMDPVLTPPWDGHATPSAVWPPGRPAGARSDSRTQLVPPAIVLTCWRLRNRAFPDSAAPIRQRRVLVARDRRVTARSTASIADGFWRTPVTTSRRRSPTARWRSRQTNGGERDDSGAFFVSLLRRA